jgi:hypothetical protein
MRASAAATPTRRSARAFALLAATACGVLLAVAGSLAGCGKKGPPRPPQFVIPESPAPVLVTAVPDGLKVQWRRPQDYADGSRIEDLGSFDVYRDCVGDGSWQPIAQLEVNDRERFRKGRTFSYVDAGMTPDSGCRYRVVAATTDGYRSPPADGAFGEVPATPEPAPTPEAPFDAGPTPEPGLDDSDRFGDRLPGALATPTPYPGSPF